MKAQEFKDVKVGDKLRIIGDYGNHRIPIGEIVTVKTRGGAGNGQYFVCREHPSVTVVPAEVSRPVIAKSNLEEEIKVLEKELKSKKELISFMKANKITEIEHREFQVYKVLSELNSQSSDLEKAQAIAKLIDG